MRAEDKPLQAPTLLKLSASVVAREDASLLKGKCTRVPCSSCHASNYSSRNAENSVVELPMTVADIVVKHICKNLRNGIADDKLVAENLRPFLDGMRKPLRRLDLSGLNISFRILVLLLAAQQSTLTSLDLSHIVLTFPQDMSSEEVRSIETVLEEKPSKLNTLKVTSCDLLTLELIISVPHFLKFYPNIQHLHLPQGQVADEILGSTTDEFLLQIFEAFETLRTLDLSEWHFPNHLYVLENNVPNLTTLILYDVKNLESSIPVISGLESLRCLDLSQSAHTTGQYSKPVTCLDTLVIKLPNLECLDISGTNLTSAISDDDRPANVEGIDFASSYIAGLSFLSRPLKYLGVFNCGIGLHFEKIPAEQICCDHGEDQIILALETYMSRPRTMKTVLDKSRLVYQFGTSLKRHVDALHLLLQVLSSHKKISSLLIATHLAMFYILRKMEMNRDTKRVVLSELLYAMENHIAEPEMVRKCCFSLTLFKIPQDFLLDYIRIATLLVQVLTEHGRNLFTQRNVLLVLNSMSSITDTNYKIQLGSIGIIEIILTIIRRKLAARVSDIGMRRCWAVLCNMTDEIPSNCERFVNLMGMQLFSRCITQFPDDDIMIRNMIILVGNVAEVKCLRGRLMYNPYLEIFRNLLYMYTNRTNEFVMSHSSAYVLAYLVIEGEVDWPSPGRRRRDVMEKVIVALGLWDLSTSLLSLIVYHSLKPVLQLLPMFGSPASQHWAVWTLVNLTSTDPEKYCRYIEEEKGEKLLGKLVYDTRVSANISILARIVLTNMDTWRNSGKTTDPTILDKAILPAKQNFNAYLKKLSRIMMRFLPVLLPVSTLVIARMYSKSYERAILPSS